MQDVLICGSKRTPIGGFGGELASMTAPELGAVAIQSALKDSEITASAVDEVFMGIVLPAGVGQAPARQASLGAGLSQSVPCTAVSKVCGSGMQAVVQACAQIKSGQSTTIIAGGMESMSNAPYLAPAMRHGARLGHGKMIDHMFFDGLEDAYEAGTLMGVFAENCADRYVFSRAQQDEYALASLSRSLEAQTLLATEIAAVEVSTRKSDFRVQSDEQPRAARPNKIPLLKPAFRKDGTVTAANASSISDGAAALVLASSSAVAASEATARARIVGYAGHAHEPGWFTTAPIGATQKLLNQIGWSVNDVDLWEVNEAFAVVPMAFMQELEIPHHTINVFGGACALGHPIGASGARILVTLLNALEQRDLSRGVAAICIGGGEALSVAIERV